VSVSGVKTLFTACLPYYVLKSQELGRSSCPIYQAEFQILHAAPIGIYCLESREYIFHFALDKLNAFKLLHAKGFSRCFLKNVVELSIDSVPDETIVASVCRCILSYCSYAFCSLQTAHKISSSSWRNKTHGFEGMVLNFSS
jgi:hypothetical protein